MLWQCINFIVKLVCTDWHVSHHWYYCRTYSNLSSIIVPTPAYSHIVSTLVWHILISHSITKLHRGRTAKNWHNVSAVAKPKPQITVKITFQQCFGMTLELELIFSYSFVFPTWHRTAYCHTYLCQCIYLISLTDKFAACILCFALEVNKAFKKNSAFWLVSVSFGQMS